MGRLAAAGGLAVASLRMPRISVCGAVNILTLRSGTHSVAAVMLHHSPARLFPQIFTALILLTGALRAGPWPQFRGPTGLGYSDEQDLPVKWNAETGENIAWKAELPAGDSQYSSPIVWGDRVFVTCVANAPLVHRVLCFSLLDGSQLWAAEVKPGPLILTDLRGGYGAPTPCTDGERVYAVFGSAVVAALDFAGKEVWRQEIRNHAFDVALGSSPILYRDSLILNCDQTGRTSTITAWKKASGELAWEAARPDTGFSHSTPVVVQVGGADQMLVSASGAIQGLDPSSGRPIWWCSAAGDASSPAFGGGVVYSDSGRGGRGVCVDPGGMGDVTASRLRWTVDQISEGLGSAIIVGPHVWRTHSPEILKAFDLETGKRVISERVSGISTWASPLATADGRIYFASAGKSYVLKAGPALEVLGMSDLGEENRATAAISQGRILLRGDKHLYCIRKP